MARTVLDVFLSSTAKDLEAHREAIYTRLKRIEFFHCIRQEDFGAQNAEAVAHCCDKARTADLFVGLIGLRRGWEPHSDNGKRSMTEMEHDAARSAGRRRYLWVSPNDFPVPGNLHETQAEHRRQLAFRKNVMAGGERIVSQKGFSSPESLALEIVEQLLAHVVTGDLIKLLRPDLAQAGTPLDSQTPAITAAVEKLAEDDDVDLLALARDPKGVDLVELEAKLAVRAEQHESAGRKENKISAEYWRHIGALASLHDTRKALAASKTAVSLDPANLAGIYQLGTLFFRVGEIEAATDTFDGLIKIANETGDQRGEINGYIWKGWLQQNRGDLVGAETSSRKALSLAESSDWAWGVALAYGNLGTIHRIRGDFYRAGEMYKQELLLSKKLGDKAGMARAYSHLGNFHLAQENLDEAEEMYDRAVKISEELGHKEGVALACGNLGVIQKMRGNLDKAEEMQRKTMSIYEELDFKDGMARAQINVGNIYVARLDFNRAEPAFQSALVLYEKLHNKTGIAAAHANLGTIYATRGDLNRAIEAHLKSLLLEQESGNKRGIAESNWNLALIYGQQGNNKRLCECLRHARDLWQELGLANNAAEAQQRMKVARCKNR